MLSATFAACPNAAWPNPSRICRRWSQEELARLIDSDALRRAPSHMRLLRYLVEKRIAGDSAALRETAIALEVFRRDPSTYDPQTDPIVRVTTGRLRERLDAHYARFEAVPKLRIVLPKGRYAPEFISTHPATPVASGACRPAHAQPHRRRGVRCTLRRVLRNASPTIWRAQVCRG